jgi:hypothetical protein
MAKDVNIKVKLSTTEAKNKLKGLEDEQRKTGRRIGARQKKTRQRERAKSQKLQGRSLRGKAKGGAAKFGAIMIIVMMILAIVKQALAGIISLGRTIAEFSSYFRGIGQSIEEFGTKLNGFISEFVGFLGRAKVVKEVALPFAQIGMRKDVNVRDASDAFAQAAAQEFQKTQQELSQLQTNFGKFIAGSASFGGD